MDYPGSSGIIIARSIVIYRLVRKCHITKFGSVETGMNMISHPNHEFLNHANLGGSPASGPLRGTAGQCDVLQIYLQTPIRRGGAPSGGDEFHRK